MEKQYPNESVNSYAKGMKGKAYMHLAGVIPLLFKIFPECPSSPPSGASVESASSEPAFQWNIKSYVTEPLKREGLKAHNIFLNVPARGVLIMLELIDYE